MATAINLNTVSGCFCTMTELSSYDRDCMGYKVPILASPSFHRHQRDLPEVQI